MNNSGKLILIIVLLLTAFGLLMVGSASIVDAARDFSDKWYYLKQQLMWTGVGMIFLFFLSKYNHRKYDKLAKMSFYITCILLVAVLLPGLGQKFLGARRWLFIGPLVFQPSELAKITMAIYFASLVTRQTEFSKYFFSVFGVAFLIFLQPDLGTSLIIIGMGLLIYLGSGRALKPLLYSGPLVIALVLIAIVISPYRFARLKTFFNMSHDPQGSSYQTRQALLAFGSGNILGVGLGQSRQKYDYLPEATTDSIYAIIGEEWGYVGTALVLFAFFQLIRTGFSIAKDSHDPFSSNLAIACTSIIGLQAFINISSIAGLFPLTGVPLPYISYGGSSLVVMLIAAGILINISNPYARSKR